MTRFAKRTDCNHAPIRDGLRQVGHQVRDCSGIGQGIPDLLVVTRKNRRVFWLEIKMPGEKLTELELEFFELFPGLCEIARSVEEAIERAETRDLEEN